MTEIEYGWRARAADWWAERFLIEEKRDEFRAALRKRLDNIEFSKLQAENDYDPRGVVLDAVRDIGIECRGFMFSGCGLFPSKISMGTVTGSFVVVKDGYGQPRQILCNDWEGPQEDNPQ